MWLSSSLTSLRDQIFPKIGTYQRLEPARGWKFAKFGFCQRPAGPPMGWELKEAKVFRGLEHIETTTCQRRDLPVAGALKRPKHPEGWDLSESGNTQRQGPTQTGNCQGPRPGASLRQRSLRSRDFPKDKKINSFFEAMNYWRPQSPKGWVMLGVGCC
ncbi:hypothetical protein J6590_102288 [Homalodisca vitripennis]|nr:hypothetical protein J6590_102288 [Homalodisca vitripennis]